MLLQSGTTLRCLGTTAGGDPRHPLMLSYETGLVEWPAG